MFTIYLYLVNHMALRKYLIKWPYEMTSRDMLFFTFKISVAIIKFFLVNNDTFVFFNSFSINDIF